MSPDEIDQLVAGNVRAVRRHGHRPRRATPGRTAGPSACPRPQAVDRPLSSRAGVSPRAGRLPSTGVTSNASDPADSLPRQALQSFLSRTWPRGSDDGWPVARPMPVAVSRSGVVGARLTRHARRVRCLSVGSRTVVAQAAVAARTDSRRDRAAGLRCGSVSPVRVSSVSTVEVSVGRQSTTTRSPPTTSDPRLVG